MLYRELFEKGLVSVAPVFILLHQSQRMLASGTFLCVWDFVCVHVCVFQKGCTEPQRGAIPDYPFLSSNKFMCVAPIQTDTQIDGHIHPAVQNI